MYGSDHEGSVPAGTRYDLSPLIPGQVGGKPTGSEFISASRTTQFPSRYTFFDLHSGHGILTISPRSLCTRFVVKIQLYPDEGPVNTKAPAKVVFIYPKKVLVYFGDTICRKFWLCIFPGLATPKRWQTPLQKE